MKSESKISPYVNQLSSIDAKRFSLMEDIKMYGGGVNITLAMLIGGGTIFLEGEKYATALLLGMSMMLFFMWLRMKAAKKLDEVEIYDGARNRFKRAKRSNA